MSSTSKQVRADQALLWSKYCTRESLSSTISYDVDMAMLVEMPVGIWNSGESGCMWIWPRERMGTRTEGAPQ